MRHAVNVGRGYAAFERMEHSQCVRLVEAQIFNSLGSQPCMPWSERGAWPQGVRKLGKILARSGSLVVLGFRVPTSQSKLQGNHRQGIAVGNVAHALVCFRFRVAVSGAPR